MKKIEINPDFFNKLQLKVDVPYKSWRDELFHRLWNGWNRARESAGFPKLSKSRLAIAINLNPFLKKDDGELELLIKECERVGNYKKAHFILFGSKKTNAKKTQ